MRCNLIPSYIGDMKRTGFSLIEIIVGMALMSLLFLLVGSVLPTIFKSSRKAAAINIAKSEGAYSLKTIVNTVKFAKNIVCSSDYLMLEVNKANLDQGVYSFDSANDAILFTDGTIANPGSDEFFLTSDRVNVNLTGCSNKMFECTSQNKSVTICFGINNVDGLDVTDSAANSNGILFRTQVVLTN